MADLETRSAAVRSPATSANLGPGFDAFALCLGLYDDLAAMTTPSGLAVQVSGEGADDVPTDESHLVIRALRSALDEMGISQPGLSVVTDNHIPHGRGLGSSASAIVAGITLAHGLYPEVTMSSAAKLRLAAALEGHPDNVAACLLGGLAVAWIDDQGAHATSLRVDDQVCAHVYIPATALSTQAARAVLPSAVPHRDAAANAGRAGLLIAALTHAPELLFAATEDRLHQAYRGPAMPETLALVESMRTEGLAAVVSGAGPSVLVLSTVGIPFPGDLAPEGWRVLPLGIEHTGAAVIRPTGPPSRLHRDTGAG